MVMPVAGLMIGMALGRSRVAEGWWILSPEDCCVWNAGGTNGGDDELSEKAGAAAVGCCGDECGEELAKDERSDAL